MKKLESISGISLILISMMLVFPNCTETLEDGGLRIGWAIEDITPDGPAYLNGQAYERLSEYVQSPLKATAIAIESEGEDGRKEQAIMISLDVASINQSLQDALKEKLKEELPDFDASKLLLNTTHTHNAPNPKAAGEFRQMVLDQLINVAVNAWNLREPAGISRALEYAVVGHNRRVEYADGTTQMYGSTDRMDFLGLEGPSDPGVDMIFCWDLQKNLTGIIMNVSCGSQITEANYYVSADFWGELRNEIKNRYSEDVFIYSQCGAAGDIAPRDLPRGYKSGQPNMWEEEGAIEIGKRLADAIDDAYPDARQAIQTASVFKHAVRNIDLPTRRVSDEDYSKAVEIAKEIRSRYPEDPDAPDSPKNMFLKDLKEKEKTQEYGPWDNKLLDYFVLVKKDALIEKYKNQGNDPFCTMELHVIRLGDVAFATNPFELYTDYAFRITGRSKARQTFVVQLSCDAQGYLSTARAIPGGGYSAMVTRVGPVGGQILVNESVDLINSMW